MVGQPHGAITVGAVFNAPTTRHHGSVELPARLPGKSSGTARAPTAQAQSWAVATVLAACRAGHIELAEAEERLHAIYSSLTMTELYAAIAGLPHPPAPLVIAPEAKT